MEIHLTHLIEAFSLHPLGCAQFPFVQRYFHELGFAQSDVTRLNDKSVVIAFCVSFCFLHMSSMFLLLLANVLRLFGKIGCQQVVTMIVLDKRRWSGSGG